MNRVASPIGMIARKAAEVVAKATIPSHLTKRARDWNATLRDKTLRATCFVTELAHGSTMHYAPRLGIPLRKVAVAAMQAYSGPPSR